MLGYTLYLKAKQWEWKSKGYIYSTEITLYCASILSQKGKAGKWVRRLAICTQKKKHAKEDPGESYLIS